eukprot:6483811-Amphidinium_carterae.1
MKFRLLVTSSLHRAGNGQYQDKSAKASSGRILLRVWIGCHAAFSSLAPPGKAHKDEVKTHANDMTRSRRARFDRNGPREEYLQTQACTRLQLRPSETQELPQASTLDY